MDDKEYQLQKSRCKKFFNTWFKRTGLSWWNVDLVFDRCYSTEKPSLAGETNMNLWRYHSGSIHLYLPVIKELDDDGLEEVIVHELSHLLVAPMAVNMDDLNSNYQLDIMEFCTTMVARALLWTYEAGTKKKTPV